MMRRGARNRGEFAPGNQAGYTLVEAIVVLLIFSLTSAIVGPRVSEALSQYRANRAAAVVASEP